MNSNLSYSPETPNLGQHLQIYVPCDLEILQMTSKNDKAPLLCHCKLCASFHSHGWIQTGVTVQKRPNWGKNCFDPFDLDLWHLTLTFCTNIIFVNGNHSWKFYDDTTRGTLLKRCHRQTDGQTEVFLELLGRSWKKTHGIQHNHNLQE